MVPAAVVSMGKSFGSVSAAMITALYPQTVAIEESASIDCARVVRGISSTEKAIAPVARHFLQRFLRSERAQETNQKLVAPQQGNVGLASAVIGAVTEYLGNDVGLREDSGAVGQDLRAFFCRRRRRDTRLRARRPSR